MKTINIRRFMATLMSVVIMSLLGHQPLYADGGDARLLLPSSFVLNTTGNVEVPQDGGAVSVSITILSSGTDVEMVLAEFRDEASSEGVAVTWILGRRSLSLSLSFPPSSDMSRYVLVSTPSASFSASQQPRAVTWMPWIESRSYYGTGASDYVSDIVYYNGLGLPFQHVGVAASGNGLSIITPVTYDECLRGDAREWLPFEGGNSSSYPVSSLEEILARYSSTYGAQESGHAFSENAFDSYSLNRKVSSRKPGSAHASADRKAVTEYGISTEDDRVMRIVYDPSSRSISVPTRPSPYVSGYQKAVTTDEDGRMSATFTDATGKVRLARIYDRTDSGEYVPYADTYTVYDGAGRPLWVISPEGSALVGPEALYTESGDVAKKWTTVYRYDGYGRLAGRRQPGCGWEEYVYDRGDRLVLERDSTLHAQGRWIYHVYDNLGREIERTVVSSTSSMESIQANYDTTPAPNSYPYPSHAGSVGADYRKPYTSIGSFTLVKQLYQARYGNYKYRTGTSTTSTAMFIVPSTLAFSAVTGVVSGESGNTNNLKVYEKVWMLDESVSSTSSNGYVERAFYYDGKGRLIQTVERNQSGGISRTSTSYDFRGLPLQISEQHSFSSSYKKASTQSRTVTYSYDNRGRVLTETVQVNSLPEATVSYSYDGIGRLSEVTYGNGVSESRTYTVQGWLKEISALDSSRDTLFRETMRYWDNPEIAGGSSHPLYSGMISGTDSRNGNGTSSSGTLDYDYSYDYLWRLTEASLPGTERWAEKGITYDRNGNLRSLTRHGGSGSILDALNLSYSGNRLAAVSHSGGTWSYGHDGSGRMTSDGRLGGIAVQYGETGLPRRTMGPPGSGITTTEYSYLADGTRLGVTQNIGTSSSTIYGYLSFGGVGMIQLGSNLSFESSVFDGGVIQSGGVRYFTRDHLGNTRVVTDGSGNVVERNDYYPFGERHSDSSMPTVNSNRWRFAGKEIQPLGDTGWLDFGARQYDSFLGRWTTVDPLAEKYPGISPYSYCAGNPINFVDPDGRKIYDANGKVVTYDSKNGWSSNADPKFVEIASLMQKYHTGTLIIDTMLSSQEKYTITFIDTFFPENSDKMGQNKVTFKTDDNGDASSIISNEITISTKAIENRKEKPEMSDLDYTAGILAHEWGHGTISNLRLTGKAKEEDANIPMNKFFQELITMTLPKITWNIDQTAHTL